MPNWCSNRIKITGKAEEIQRFQQSTKGQGATYEEERRRRADNELAPEIEIYDFSFNSLVPVPLDVLTRGYSRANISLQDLENPHAALDGYHWQLKHWGTKWDANDADVSLVNDTELQIWMHTAWSPPVPWLLEAARLFPQLIFDMTYQEPGMNFAGQIKVQSDTILENRHWEPAIEYDNEDDDQEPGDAPNE